jgi:hypothetical protein
MHISSLSNALHENYAANPALQIHYNIPYSSEGITNSKEMSPFKETPIIQPLKKFPNVMELESSLPCSQSL